MLDNTEEVPTDIGEAETDSGKRASPDRSTIAFPYTHLEDAANVARSIYESGVDLSRDQVAGVLNLLPTSGGFSLKINAARMFGLAELIDGKYHVSALGERVLSSDESEAKAARREAFLRVELYQKAFETFRNRPLPNRPHGLENAFVTFGVAPKQKDKARLAFERSAQFAGFFHAGKDRLVEPILPGAVTSHRQTEQPQAPAVTEAPIAETLPVAAQQPLIKGLLERLPAPDTSWSLGERARWLRALAVNLAMIYGEKDELDITIQAPHPVSRVAAVIAKAAAPQVASVQPKPPTSTLAQAAPAGGDLDDEIPF